MALASTASLFAAVLASDYQVKTVKVQPVEAYPAQGTLGGITVAADPYDTNEKSYTAFDVKDLNSRGYFPLHVIIQNSSPGIATIKTRNIQLRTASGQQLYTISATLVVQDVFRGGLTTKLPKMKSKDPATSTRAGSPLLDFTAKELTNRQIDTGVASDGFLFFFTPEPRKQLFEGATLIIPEIWEDSLRRAIGPFEILLDPATSAASGKK